MDMDVTNRFTKDLYKDQEFWLLLLGLGGSSFLLTRSITLTVVLPILALLTSLVLVFGKPLLDKYRNRKDAERKTPELLSDDNIVFGELESNNKPVSLTMEILNHVFIIGMTRYGKTRLVLSLITEFIDKYHKDEIKLAFSDAKAVSFNVFGRSQHLFAPIAKSVEETGSLIEILLVEMHRRLALFSEYHEEICTNIDEYFELSGERLPRIVVIFDEVADSVEKESLAEKNLTTLAKMGLAAGIHLILITQRPTKVGISHEITSQCQSILCTYMKNATEYGSVAKIPQKVYSKMRPEKGLFMMFNPDTAPYFLSQYPEYEGWGFIRSNYVDNNIIKGIAIVDSTEHLSLPDLQSSIPAWKGSEEDKLTAIEVLESQLGIVTEKDMKKYFGVGRRTAKTWLDKYQEERK